MRHALVVVGMLSACDTGPRAAAPVADRDPPAAPVAFAVVVNTQEIFVGNDQYEPDENARYAGAFVNIAAAFDRHPPASLLPHGSLGGVIGYSTGAKTLVAMGPVERVNGLVFSDQRPHRGNIGFDLVIGIERGIDELSRVTASRKILLVVGDGNDTNYELAKAKLVEIQRTAKAARVETVALLWRSHCDGAVVERLDQMLCTNSIDGFSRHLRAVLQPAD